MLYTDAPINEEYEKEQARIMPCARCKKKYAKKELLEYEEKYYCHKRFVKTLDKETRKDRKTYQSLYSQL